VLDDYLTDDYRLELPESPVVTKAELLRQISAGEWAPTFWAVLAVRPELGETEATVRSRITLAGKLGGETTEQGILSRRTYRLTEDGWRLAGETHSLCYDSGGWAEAHREMRREGTHVVLPSCEFPAEPENP
jgi:hypothetical protein